jgi:uncharacterized membrane protein YgcG
MVVGAALCLASLPASAESDDVVKAPVTDYAEVIPKPVERHVGEKLKTHARETGIEMAVVVLKTAEGEPLDEVAQRIVGQWEGGDAGIQRAILLTVVTGDGRMHLQVGSELRNALPKGWVARLSDSAYSTLKAGDYQRVVREVTDRVIERTGSLEPGEKPGKFASNPLWDPILGGWITLVLAWVVSMLLIVLADRGVQPFSSERGLVWRMVVHALFVVLIVGVTLRIAWQGYVIVYGVGALCGLILARGTSWRRYFTVVAVIVGIALSVLKPGLLVWYNDSTDWALNAFAIWIFVITGLPYYRLRFFGNDFGPGASSTEDDNKRASQSRDVSDGESASDETGVEAGVEQDEGGESDDQSRESNKNWW